VLSGENPGKKFTAFNMVGDMFKKEGGIRAFY
jgi:hypothetical protein